jgi:hypothetical protein
MYVPSGVSAKVTWLGTAVGTPEPTEGYVGVWSALPSQYQAGAKWYMHRGTLGATIGLVDTTGRPIVITPGTFSNATEKPTFSILGDPIEVTNFMPVQAANSYSVLYGDMRGYYIADRVGMSIEVLREVKALRDEVVVYSRKRVGAQLAHGGIDIVCAQGDVLDALAVVLADKFLDLYHHHRGSQYHRWIVVLRNAYQKQLHDPVLVEFFRLFCSYYFTSGTALGF